MATAPLPISELEYLSTTYEPDCDFIDGVLEERTLGDEFHADLQALLATIFHNRGPEWGVRVRTAWRANVGVRRYRIPDVTVIARSEGRKGGVAQTPPLLCIEIW